MWFFNRPRKVYPTNKLDIVMVKSKHLAVGDVLSTGETITNVILYAKLEFVQVQLDKSNDLIQYDKTVYVHIKNN